MQDSCQGDSGGPLVAHNPYDESYTLTGESRNFNKVTKGRFQKKILKILWKIP